MYNGRNRCVSRYSIFRREILYRARREIKFIFKRKKYQLLLLLFLLFNKTIGDLICNQHIPSRRKSWRLSPNILRSREPRFLCTFIKFRNSHYPHGYFSQRMNINFWRNDIDRIRLFNSIVLLHF